ncbi:MAG: hypothetical protein JWQ04_1201 [Pedosphaera sp.]|nr:hypothetical protein [Pedosphaera sp.]
MNAYEQNVKELSATYLVMVINEGENTVRFSVHWRKFGVVPAT